MENETLIPKASTSSVFYSFASIALVIAGLLFFEGILKPLVIAVLIWFIINKIKLSIEAIKIKGKSFPPFVSSTLAILIVILISLLISELLIRNLEAIAATMPVYMAKLNESFGALSALLNNPKYADYIHKWLDGVDFAGIAKTFIGSISSFLGNFVVVLVYVIFFILENSTQKLKIEKLFPVKGKVYKKFMNNMAQISASVQSFLWQKTLISLITAGVDYVILLLMGVEYAFLWSFLIFISSFIPYIGALFSSLIPAIFAFLVTGDIMKLVYVFAALETVEILLGNFVEPKIMGKGTNLGPVTVIVALAFWGMIWGIVGMILAVPIMAVLVIALSQIPSTRYLAILLSEKGNIAEIE
ncbi:MAG: AI-2E family transporter [Flavobacteriaceae bacterium]